MRAWLFAWLLTAAPLGAAEWLNVGAPGPDRMFYDPEKLHVEDNAAIYWRRVDFRMPMPVREGLAYTGLYRERIDCRQRMLATLGFLLYAGDGKVLENVYTPEARAVPIVPDSAAERFLQTLCPLVAARREQAEAARDPRAAEIRRLEDELKAIEDAIRGLRQDESAPGAGAQGMPQ